MRFYNALLCSNSSTLAKVLKADIAMPCNVARFRLHSHVLRVETRSWEHHDGTCDKFGFQAIQDEFPVSDSSPCMQICFLNIKERTYGSSQNLPTPTNDLLPSSMVEVCLALEPDVIFLIHANRGYLVGAVFLSFKCCFCSLRLQFADLFHDLPLAHKITVNQTGAFYFSHWELGKLALRMSSFSPEQTNESYRFVSELAPAILLV